MNFGVVILAGGAGRRIGGRKPFRALAGKPLFEHVLDLALAWRVPLAVSVRDPGEWVGRDDLRMLTDGDEPGPIAGVAAALRFAAARQFDAVLTVPCDTPFLPADLMVRLAETLVPPAGAALAASAGRYHPSCAIWATAAAGELPRYLATGSSLLGFARSLQAQIVEWPGEPFDPFFNVNSADDLAAAEAILKAR